MEQPQIEKKFRAGAISATVWKNITAKDGQVFDYNTISLDRSYKDPSGAWKNTASMRLNDLPKAALVLQEAFRYLTLNDVNLSKNRPLEPVIL